ncbi:hypothetical protein PCANC_10995 [Puccinia coronata f. sp. avenae]|uniref:Ubiquinol-cytochrome C reductase hinge domain-containing protein n=1 Tax=Puccinia coronata f. sp. avenae TaxID=200324 RepID=A0A2N5USW1_9BASI|nr:hypothetical protein PCASD_21824 [Puccinia coronata f. sp. avenae]PLW17146.1 hypothetical protein PCANC_11778 [Puccinia coronata f. sp. avenae]PLW36892.1 hypothetical protein PCASD_10186 [Puccinia coronata f. sp. avenae]PLW40839.1 hypothetical protein PCANC_10995 [Puccinia coronata f. sp. avenae]
MTASNPLTEVCSNAVSAITQFFTPTVSAESKQPSENEEEQQEGEGGGEEEEGEKEEEEEEDEPEDPAPAIREECAESKCSKYKHHFDHCQERVLGGKGDKGEDCVEELFHLMHCVDDCATPQIFRKLV